MLVLLTGSFGNIGSHTIPALLSEGHRVRCFDLPGPAHERAARRAIEQAARSDGAADRLEFRYGDIRDASAVSAAVSGVEAVIHLAASIPPGCNSDPEGARQINVEGTRNLIGACRAGSKPPRLLFTSSLDVFGRTQSRDPPRTADEPVSATDPYTEHKLAGEEMVRGSGLSWCIFRFSDVPIIGLRAPHPIMFEIGLHNRIEALHADDAAFALARALVTEEAWGRLLLVGGGPSCRLTYGEYLRKLLEAMGVGMLPENAFSRAEYVTDWLDSSEAERLFRYQRHTFDDIVSDIASCLGWKKLFVPLARPFVRRAMIDMSPYAGGTGDRPARPR